MRKKFFYLFTLLFLIFNFTLNASEAKEEYISGKIINLISVEKPTTEDESVKEIQKYNVKLLEGNDKNEIIEVDLPIYKNTEYNIGAEVGDKVVIYKSFQNYENNESKIEYYISDIDKRTDIYIMLGIFGVLILAIAKKNGIKAMVALVTTIFFIVFIFIPAIQKGNSPIFFAVLTCIFSSLITISFTMGINKKFLVALLGTISGVVISGLLSYIFTYKMRINGYLDSDILASAYLFKNINLKELIPAGVIIGSLGAVMDVAVSITSAINELYETNEKLTKKSIFKSALNIGNDIIGTMINTLILAYIASSLFTLLLIYIQANDYPAIRILNYQDIAVEIMRSVCGSIGILIAIPITAFIGSNLFSYKNSMSSPKSK